MKNEEWQRRRFDEPGCKHDKAGRQTAAGQMNRGAGRTRQPDKKGQFVHRGGDGQYGRVEKRGETYWKRTIQESKMLGNSQPKRG